jgi:hypothetical protein
MNDPTNTQIDFIDSECVYIFNECFEIDYLIGFLFAVVVIFLWIREDRRNSPWI